MSDLINEVLSDNPAPWRVEEISPDDLDYREFLRIYDANGNDVIDLSVHDLEFAQFVVGLVNERGTNN